MKILNLGILAHVDAGKTSLTERLLYSAGVIDRVGSVDSGTTQTDTLALERQRGITIKAAVVSFAISDTTVNLIDTPGHPDFIAEVERVLGVLDGAVLVISAVEGVQAQTRVLLRTLKRLRIPTLLFINKIDRTGANTDRVLQAIAEKLTPAIVPMGTTQALGSRAATFVPYQASDTHARLHLAELLANHNEAVLAAYVQNEAISYDNLRAELATQTGQALVHPVFCGSAISGAGVEALMAGIHELLPAPQGNPAGPLAGSVFKIERGPTGEKIAYVRLFSGSVRVRDLLHTGNGHDGRVTALSVFAHGAAVRGTVASAGQIAKLWGLGDIQIGDTIGNTQLAPSQHGFAPPTLETIIVPRHAAERAALHAALAQLAEQDPLINLRRDDLRQELFVSLYGEVQKEVIQATLASDFNIDVEFHETTMICVERPIGSGTAVELIGKPPNPFLATVGLKIEPAPAGTGITFRLDAELGAIPIYVYKSVEAFQAAMEETVRHTLQQGLYGWQVIDCIVTMTDSGYWSPTSSARDFRLLTPLVLMQALQVAGTSVCAPMHHFQLEIPADTLGATMALLTRLHATPQASLLRGAVYVLTGSIPAAQVHTLQQRLPGLTRGEGLLESSFDHYTPISGPAPARPRSDNNPLNRKEYLLHLARRL